MSRTKYLWNPDEKKQIGKLIDVLKMPAIQKEIYDFGDDWGAFGKVSIPNL